MKRGGTCKTTLKRCLSNAGDKKARGKCLGQFSKCRSRRGR